MKTEVGKTYARSDGIYRTLLAIVQDPRFSGGFRADFDYWDPIKGIDKDRGHCGLETFESFSDKEVDPNNIIIEIPSYPGYTPPDPWLKVRVKCLVDTVDKEIMDNLKEPIVHLGPMGDCVIPEQVIDRTARDQNQIK